MLSLPRNTRHQSDIKLIKKVGAASARVGGCQGHGIRVPRVEQHVRGQPFDDLRGYMHTQARRFKIALTFGELHQDLTHFIAESRCTRNRQIGRAGLTNIGFFASWAGFIAKPPRCLGSDAREPEGQYAISGFSDKLQTPAIGTLSAPASNQHSGDCTAQAQHVRERNQRAAADTSWEVAFSSTACQQAKCQAAQLVAFAGGSGGTGPA